MRPITLTVPMPAREANGSHGHWSQRHRRKKAYWAALDALQASGRLPPPPPEPWARVAITSTMILGTGMDDDNAVARHKRLLDWLKTRGYIADDRRYNVRWAAFPTQIVTRKKRPAITLTLTPLEEAAA